MVRIAALSLVIASLICASPCAAGNSRGGGVLGGGVGFSPATSWDRTSYYYGPTMGPAISLIVGFTVDRRTWLVLEGHSTFVPAGGPDFAMKFTQFRWYHFYSSSRFADFVTLGLGLSSLSTKDNAFFPPFFGSEVGVPSATIGGGIELNRYSLLGLYASGGISDGRFIANLSLMFTVVPVAPRRDDRGDRWVSDE